VKIDDAAGFAAFEEPENVGEASGTVDVAAAMRAASDCHPSHRGRCVPADARHEDASAASKWASIRTGQ
jgi:hypothetical protein